MNRRARINPVIALCLLVLSMGGIIYLMLYLDRHAVGAKGKLLVYCDERLKMPIEQIGRDYQKETGVFIELVFTDSSAELSEVRSAHKGDLFLTADENDIRTGQNQGLIQGAFSVAVMHPVLAVKKGNPRNIRSIDDLLQNGITIALANADSTTIGKLTRPALQEAGYWDWLKPHSRDVGRNVNDVAGVIKAGTADAGIIWDTTTRQFDGLDVVPVHVFDGVGTRISLGVLSTSNDPTGATKFVKYVAATEKGGRIFEKNGYTPMTGDGWAMNGNERTSGQNLVVATWQMPSIHTNDRLGRQVIEYFK